MPMSIYFTRHGQTDWNSLQLIQGRINVPLNETGIAQAAALAEQMKDIHLDAIISSPLRRAYDTAKAINVYHNLPIEIDNRIIEEYYGTMEREPRKGDRYFSHRHSFAKRYPGGEGYFDVVYRVYDFLNDLKANRRDQDILIVAHGGMSRIVHSYFCDLENEEFVNYGIQNCELVRYEFVDRNIPLSIEDY